MLGWLALRWELRRWRTAGARARFWWRDDDATTVTAALLRLLQLADAAAAPLTLAVVPGPMDGQLIGAVDAHPTVTVVQHGFRHDNHAKTGPAHEFSEDLPRDELVARLTAGRRKVSAFKRWAPVYVPPWNALPPHVAQALDLAGLTAVSGWGGDSSKTRIDTHIDLLRWQPHPRFKGRSRLLRQITRALADRRHRGAWAEPIGLLSHHLDHDPAAWSFLEALFRYPPLRAQSDWLAIDALLPVQACAAA